ncbi:MAG: T9SS type A sorting domain-containing protein [Bacteroidetes bacterium]|nr:T9SS type A sorting domain-containing protein [Bacteroidota bacterium]
MRKITLIFLTIFVTVNIYSQTYTISFTATGAATSVDSVIVENLTHPATVKWHVGDVLQLVLSNGVTEKTANETVLKVYPNPMQGKAELSFYAKQSGNTTLSIYDIAGKAILQTEHKLLQGIQKFQLTGLRQGIYFVIIKGDNYFYSAKLISQNTNPNIVKIESIGNENNGTFFSGKKGTNVTVTMSYTSGDSLRFIGYANILNSIIIDVPNISKTIIFGFNRPDCPTEITDIDGNIYSVVSIGNQCWMGENLNTTHYRNGDSIPNVTDANAWIALTTGAFCNKDNTPGNSIIYGRLYNFYSTIDPRNLCPAQWHVPSDSEWTVLENYLGGVNLTAGKLKEVGISHWLTPNVGATNEYGFTALPGGGRGCNGVFSNYGNGNYVGTWWSSSAYSTTTSWGLNFYYNESKAYMYNDSKTYGYSVRCLRD